MNKAIQAVAQVQRRWVVNSAPDASPNHYPGHRVAGYLTQRPMHYPGTASLGIRPSTQSTPLSIDSAPIMAIQAPNGYGVTVNRQCPYQTNYGHSDATKYGVKGHSCFNNYRVKGYSTPRAVGATVNRRHPYQNKNMALQAPQIRRHRVFDPAVGVTVNRRRPY
ncbi:hypothetical protein B0H14DRAFT_2633298 [Mycena olivaceomarginata]|nr:hypothetical protein B0H14DRAFT_2633298 [Mycena olivaceomarginata]